MANHAMALHFVWTNSLVWEVDGKKKYFGRFRGNHFVIGPLVISWKRFYD